MIQKEMVSINDSQYPYEHDEDVLGHNIQNENAETESNVRREKTTHKNLVETIISFNVILMKAQEE